MTDRGDAVDGTAGVLADECDVLVVGAGPTGLVLADELAAFGVLPRVVDRNADRVHESRALAVQPRTLEVLRRSGVTDELVAAGNPGARLHVHAGRRTRSFPLFDLGLSDTAFPFLLFVSQARTEELLAAHGLRRGVVVERSTTLEDLADDGGPGVLCRLRRPDGTAEHVRARWVVGCDGAHSTVRERCGIAFPGGRYPQTFLLADLPVAGLDPDAVHAFLATDGPLVFFPLGRPAPWRLITARTEAGRRAGPGDAAQALPTSAGPVGLAELQAHVDRASAPRLRLGEPVWASAFSVHHRLAAAYRSGRAFLAGDAAHIHSPAGGQGMNTGIQDAANLAWKLALVVRGAAPERLLDSYQAERRPVGAFVVGLTDRLFTAVSSTHPLIRLGRARVVPVLLPLILGRRTARAVAFRTISQLGVRYPGSPAVAASNSRAPRWPRARPRPRPGDRLPDVRVFREGESGWLQEELLAPAFHLLLCGPLDGCDEAAVTELQGRVGSVLRVVRLDRHAAAGVLADPSGRALTALDVRSCTAVLVRPDGYVAVRCDRPRGGGRVDLSEVGRYLTQWVTGVGSSVPTPAG